MAFKDYAEVFGMDEALYKDGIDAYVVENIAQKQNLKAMLCLPYTFDLDSKEVGLPDNVKTVCNVLDPFWKRHLSPAHYEQYQDISAPKNIFTNTMPNGMKYTKALLKFFKSIDVVEIPQVFEDRKESDMRTVLYDYLKINRDTRITVDIYAQRLSWYMSNYNAPMRCVVSTEIEDILSCSSDCSWTSCYNPTGSYRAAPFALSLDSCTAIAIFYKGESKVGRCWVHIDSTGSRFVLGRNYGNIPDAHVAVLRDKLASLLGFSAQVKEDYTVWTQRKHDMMYVDGPMYVMRDAAIDAATLGAGTLSAGSPAIFCLHCGKPITKDIICSKCMEKMKKCRSCGSKTFAKMEPVFSGAAAGQSAEACPMCVKKNYYARCKCCNCLVTDAKKGMCHACYMKQYSRCDMCGFEYETAKHKECPACSVKATCKDCGEQFPIFKTIPVGAKRYQCIPCFTASFLTEQMKEAV